jgi:hypothetical protein
MYTAGANQIMLVTFEKNKERCFWAYDSARILTRNPDYGGIEQDVL